MHLKQELGLTFMIVTHDQEEAMTVADRIGVMNQGRLMQVATAPELYEQPNSRWVADFVGDVNLIEGRVVEAGADTIVIESAVVGRVRAAAAAGAKSGAKSGAKPGDTVWVALRPEKVRLSLEQRAATENSVSGSVRDIAYLGDLSIYKVALDNGLVMEAATANLTRMIERPISWDDRVWLTWDAAAGIVLTQ
jgi:putrescine transport system ATP-binding protein